MFILIARDVDLEQSADHTLLEVGPLRDGFQQTEAVDRVQERDDRQCANQLVTLQMADKMPTHRKILERFGLGPKILRTTLRQIVTASFEELTCQRERNVLGCCDELNVFA